MQRRRVTWEDDDRAAIHFHVSLRPIADDPQPVRDLRPMLEAPAAPIINRGEKVRRNDPCPCGSGKKYKKCCLKKR